MKHLLLCITKLELKTTRQTAESAQLAFQLLKKGKINDEKKKTAVFIFLSYFFFSPVTKTPAALATDTSCRPQTVLLINSSVSVNFFHSELFDCCIVNQNGSLHAARFHFKIETS